MRRVSPAYPRPQRQTDRGACRAAWQAWYTSLSLHRRGGKCRKESDRWGEDTFTGRPSGYHVRGDGWVRCQLREDQTPILTLAVRTGALKPVARSRTQFITARDGYPLWWEFVSSAQRKRSSHKASDVQLELGSHPIAQELRNIQLGRAVACEHAPQSQGILTHVLESFAVSDSGSPIPSAEAIA